jgi:hypothetical protein
VLTHLGESKEALNCIAVLNPAIEKCSLNLIAKASRNALDELRRLGESEHVQKLIAAWSPMIDQSNVEPCDEELDTAMYAFVQAVSQALHGVGPRVQ